MKLLLVAACLAMASATVIKDDNLFNFVIGKESLGKKLLGYRKNAINNSVTHKIFQKILESYLIRTIFWNLIIRYLQTK